MNPSSELQAIMQKRLARCEQGQLLKNENEVDVINSQSSKGQAVKDNTARFNLRFSSAPSSNTKVGNKHTGPSSSFISQRSSRIATKIPDSMHMETEIRNSFETFNSGMHSANENHSNEVDDETPSVMLASNEDERKVSVNQSLTSTQILNSSIVLPSDKFEAIRNKFLRRNNPASPPPPPRVANGNKTSPPPPPPLPPTLSIQSSEFLPQIDNEINGNSSRKTPSEQIHESSDKKEMIIEDNVTKKEMIERRETDSIGSLQGMKPTLFDERDSAFFVTDRSPFESVSQEKVIALVSALSFENDLEADGENSIASSHTNDPSPKFPSLFDDEATLDNLSFSNINSVKKSHQSKGDFGFDVPEEVENGKVANWNWNKDPFSKSDNLNANYSIEDETIPDKYIPPPSFGFIASANSSDCNENKNESDDDSIFEGDDDSVQERIKLNHHQVSADFSGFGETLVCQNPLSRNIILCRRRCEKWCIDEVNISNRADEIGSLRTITSMDISFSDVQRALSTSTNQDFNGAITCGIESILSIAAGVFFQGGNPKVQVVAIVRLLSIGMKETLDVTVSWLWGCSRGSSSLHRLTTVPSSSYNTSSLCCANDVFFISGRTHDKPVIYMSIPQSFGSWFENVIAVDARIHNVVHMRTNYQAHLLAVSLDNGSMSVWSYDCADFTSQSNNLAASPKKRMKKICILSVDKFPRNVMEGSQDKGESFATSIDDENIAMDTDCCHLTWLPSEQSVFLLAASFKTGVAIYNITLPTKGSTIHNHSTPSISELSTDSDPYEKSKTASDIPIISPFAGNAMARKGCLQSRVEWVDCDANRIPIVATAFFYETEIMVYFGSLDLPSYGHESIESFLVLSTLSEATFHRTEQTTSPKIYGTMKSLIAVDATSISMFYPSIQIGEHLPLTNIFHHSFSLPVASKALGLMSDGSPLKDHNDVLHIYSTLNFFRKDKSGLVPPTSALGIPYYRFWLCRSRAGDRPDLASKDRYKQTDFPTAGSITDIICDLTCSNAASSSSLAPIRIERDSSSCLILFSSRDTTKEHGDLAICGNDAIAFAALEINEGKNTINTFALHPARDAVYVHNSKGSEHKIIVLEQDGKWLQQCSLANIEKDLLNQTNRSRIFNEGSVNDVRLRVRRLLIFEDAIVFLAYRKTDGNACLFLSRKMNFEANSHSLISKKLQKIWLEQGEEILSMIALPRSSSAVNMAVGTTNRVIIISVGFTLQIISEVRSKLTCPTLSPIGSFCVAFVEDCMQSGTCMLRYLSCLRSKESALICSLPRYMGYQVPYLLLGLRPDRILYVPHQSIWNNAGGGEQYLSLQRPATKPFLSLEPLVANALSQEKIKTNESSQQLLLTILKKFGPKLNPNPHNESEGLGTAGAGTTRRVHEMIGPKLSAFLETQDKNPKISPWVGGLPSASKTFTRLHNSDKNRYSKTSGSSLLMHILKNKNKGSAMTNSSIDTNWNDNIDNRIHVWCRGPFNNSEEILLLDNFNEWVGRCRPAIVGKAGAEAAAESGERTLQDILAAAKKSEESFSSGEESKDDVENQSHQGWVDNVGEGRTDDENLSLYLRFSEGENGRWTDDGFKDITVYGNKVILMNENLFTVAKTSSNVDEGEHGKVRPLYDLVFQRDTLAHEQAGVAIKVPRGSSLDVGMFHSSAHDSRQRATLEFWYFLPNISSEIILARRSICEEEDEDVVAGVSETSAMLWELVVLTSGHLELRTNDGSTINSISTKLKSEETPIPCEDKNTDPGMVSLPRDDGYGGWNHVSLLFSCRNLDTPEQCNISLLMKGKLITSSIVSFQMPRLNTDENACAVQNTVLLFGLGGLGGLRFTEIRLWSCLRSNDDIKMMMHEYLDIAKTKKKFKVAIRKKTSLAGKSFILKPPSSGETNAFLDRPRLTSSASRNLDADLAISRYPEITSFANFSSSSPSAVDNNKDEILQSPAVKMNNVGIDSAVDETIKALASSINSDSSILVSPEGYTTSMHESPLISEEIRKSAAAALVRGPPAARHFGGNRGGGAEVQDKRSNACNICICGSEKTVIFSPDKSRQYPIIASGAIISDSINGTEYLCCFLAKDKRIVVFDLQSKIVVVELQMTTKLNFWRYLSPSAHGGTLVFMLITPAGGFHWMPLDSSPRPRQIWKRGKELQGKKIVSYEEGGSNGLPGSGCRTTIALTLTSSATSGDPVEAWCIAINSGGGSEQLCLSTGVLGAALFNPYSSIAEEFDPMVITITEDKADENSVNIDVSGLLKNPISGCLEKGERIAGASFLRKSKTTLPQPTMAMGIAPSAFVLCCEQFVAVILRNEGSLIVYKFDDNKSSTNFNVIQQKKLDRYVVDASIRLREDDTCRGIDIIALLCDRENLKDGRIVTVSISDNYSS
eukprot:CAMPEP_0194106814 /NCGR_PEP_ID=MMETSP0150-20130528/6783_1 /TAXON_ID=122233 /ORGANISM="Chaetoceros debilis, Strain MM31A-1" /LENGTH=2377 /DNA_ID=CAMNT_0038795057 /DNA_START=138 /DNA_END=7274 /DNA_ORIENTATION=-